MIRLAAALLALFLALLLVGPEAPAQGVPPADRRAEREWLFQALGSAPTEQLGRVVEDQVWLFWLRQAPDQESADLMSKALERRNAYDFAGAIGVLDRLVEQAPGWAEAWNQRAAMLFLEDDLARSLADIERTLELEPRHFGALAGKARILLRQGQPGPARKALRRAVEIHPWLKERNLLPPEPPGTAL